MSTCSQPAASQTGRAERTVKTTCAEQQAEILAGLECALSSGLEHLNDIERTLASETEHFSHLRRCLCEAHDAMHSARLRPVSLLREPGAGELPPHEGPLVHGVPVVPREVSSEIARAAAARTPDGELLRTVIHRLAPGADFMRMFRLPLPPAAFAEVEGVHLWPRVREAWREHQAPLIAARRALAESGVSDDQPIVALRAAVEEHLAFAVQLHDENPWAVPGSDENEASRVTSGMHTLDVLVAAYLEKLGREGSRLRGVGHQAAEEVRRKARERWAGWVNALAPAPEDVPPWQRWRNRALFPTVLARVLWRGEVQSRVTRARAKPPGTIYAVFHSITRVSASQLELGLDGQGRHPS